jgi:hypothetical protein
MSNDWVISGGTIGLAAYSGDSVNNQGVIEGGVIGVLASGAPGISILNAGTVIGESGAGVVLRQGGVIQNSGGSASSGRYGLSGGYDGGGIYVVDISGGVSFGGILGTIGAYSHYALYFHPERQQNVFNISDSRAGTIIGGSIGVQSGYAGETLGNAGTIRNAGLIEGGEIGVALFGGGSLANNGLIEGGTVGVALLGGGTIGNAGLITGGLDGIYAGAGSAAAIVNAGTIIGTIGSGVAMAGSTLVNAPDGLIEGGADGVSAGGGALVLNAGLIEAAPSAGSTGALLTGGARLLNLAAGTIAGPTGVLISGNDATLINAGTIIGTGGEAIAIAPSVDPAQVTLTTGSMLQGDIDGGGTDGQIALAGTGTLTNDISDFGAGSALTVTQGADWTAIGNWTIASVLNSGTLQAGMLGTPLNLTGNFTQGPGGTLQVIVTPTISTQFIVTGTALLSGNLVYAFAPGAYAPHTYPFIEASGGATADDLTIEYLGDAPAGLTKTTNANGTLGANLILASGGASAAPTPSPTPQGAPARFLVAPEDDSLFSAADQLGALGAQDATSSLLGKAAEGEAAPAKAAACAAAESTLPDATSPGSGNLASHIAQAIANAFCGAGGWIEGTGTAATIDGGAAGYDADAAGFLAGVDRPFGPYGTRVGLAVGYDSFWLNDIASGHAEIDTARVGLFGSQPAGMFTLAGDFLYGRETISQTRQTGIGPAASNLGGNVFSVGVQAATEMDLGGLTVVPASGFRAAALDAGSFAETTAPRLAPFAVKGGASSYTSLVPYLTVTLSHSFLTSAAVEITPNAAFGYLYEAGDRSSAVDVTAPDGTMFASSRINLDPSAAQLSLGLTAGKNNWSLYGRYAATIAGNWTSQTGEAGLEIRF